MESGIIIKIKKDETGKPTGLECMGIETAIVAEGQDVSLTPPQAHPLSNKLMDKLRDAIARAVSEFKSENDMVDVSKDETAIAE